MPAKRNKKRKPTAPGKIQQLTKTYQPLVAYALLEGNLSTVLQTLHNDIDVWNKKHPSDKIEHKQVTFERCSGNRLRIPNVFHALNHSPDLAENWDLLKDHLPDSVYHFDEPYTLLDWASDSHQLEYLNNYGYEQCEYHGPLFNLVAFLIFERNHKPGNNFNLALTIDRVKKSISIETSDSDSDDAETATEQTTSHHSSPAFFANSRPLNTEEKKAEPTETTQATIQEELQKLSLS